MFPEFDALVSENTCTPVVTVGPVLSVSSSGHSSRLPSLDKVPLEQAATDRRNTKLIQIYKPRRLTGLSPGFSYAPIGWRKLRCGAAATSTVAPVCSRFARCTAALCRSEIKDDTQEIFWSRLIDTPIMFPLKTILPST